MSQSAAEAGVGAKAVGFRTLAIGVCTPFYMQATAGLDFDVSAQQGLSALLAAGTVELCIWFKLAWFTFDPNKIRYQNSLKKARKEILSEIEKGKSNGMLSEEKLEEYKKQYEALGEALIASRVEVVDDAERSLSPNEEGG